MPVPNPPSYSYADPRRLIAAALASFLPPPRISVAEWAAAERYLSNDGGGYTGRWSHDQAPYLIGPMEALADFDVAAVGPGQCGKTTIAENWLGQSIATDPADFLWFMQTDASLEAYVKSQIDTKLIDMHPKLLARRGLARSDNSIHYKRFAGMTVEFLSATPANMINKKAPRIVADEYDAYDQLSSDPKTLIDVRRQTFGRESRVLYISHADRAGGLAPSKWTEGIMAVYAQSDRRTWWWQCPECGCWSSPNPGTEHMMALNYDPEAALDDIAAHAHLVCPHHGCIVPDQARRRMNLTGRWVAQGERIDPISGEVTGARVERQIAGFWIVGVMSPFVRIGALARERVNAERKFAINGQDDDLRTIVVKHWGFPYDPPRQLGRVEATTLADRAEPGFALGTVPAGVRFITAAIDIQSNRFEVLYRGWGTDRESWVIAHQVLRGTPDDPVNPATQPADWDDMLEQVVGASFPLADGSGRVMGVRAVGFDSQGEAGVTVQAYAAWKRQRSRRRARMLGLVSGREAWTLLPLRGASTKAARNLVVSYPDTDRRDRRAAARGEIPVGIFNANQFKDGLAAQLNRAEPGAGYVHFPYALRSADAPHVFFEQLVAEERKPSGEWVKLAARNEATDLMVMSAVMAHLHAPSRFNWANPPAWAAAWDGNPLVTVPAPTLGSEAAPASRPAPLSTADAIRDRIRARMPARGTTLPP